MANPLYREFGNAFKSWRESHGYTFKEVAEKVLKDEWGKPVAAQRTIQDWEGANHLPLRGAPRRAVKALSPAIARTLGT